MTHSYASDSAWEWGHLRMAAEGEGRWAWGHLDLVWANHKALSANVVLSSNLSGGTLRVWGNRQMSIKISFPLFTLGLVWDDVCIKWRIKDWIFHCVYRPPSLSAWSRQKTPHPATFTIVFRCPYSCMSPSLNFELPEGRAGIKHPQSLWVYPAYSW